MQCRALRTKITQFEQFTSCARLWSIPSPSSRCYVHDVPFLFRETQCRYLLAWERNGLYHFASSRIHEKWKCSRYNGYWVCALCYLPWVNFTNFGVPCTHPQIAFFVTCCALEKIVELSATISIIVNNLLICWIRRKSAVILRHLQFEWHLHTYVPCVWTVIVWFDVPITLVNQVIFIYVFIPGHTIHQS